MKEINVFQMAVCLRHACAQIVSHESELTAIDTVIGDGDHGTGMKLGFSRLDTMLRQNSFCDMQTLLRSSGLELVKTMGGASGVIFGSLLIGGCAACAEKTVLDAQALTAVFTDAADSISRRGGAKRGDKTMLDALLGAVDAMQAAEGGDIEAVLQAAQTGAETGAEATRHMLPRFGRSKNFRDQALGYPDAGAVSTALFFRGLREGLSEQSNQEV